MDGNRLDLYFNQGKMDKAIVSGKAQSTYFYVKKDRSVSGKNEATGDTIHISFDAQKNAVKSLKLLGGGTMASGRYIDMEKTERLKREAAMDSLKQVKDSTAMVTTAKKPNPFEFLKKKHYTPSSSSSDLVNSSSSSRKGP